MAADDFERASYLENGMFYTCIYAPGIADVPKTYDLNPLIFILGPWKYNVNCIVAVNFHLIADIGKRCDILNTIQKFGDISSSDIAVPQMTENAFRMLFPMAKDAIRVYNRKNLDRVYRIKSDKVGLYIENTYGDIKLAKPSTIMNKYWLNYGENTTAESTK